LSYGRGQILLHGDEAPAAHGGAAITRCWPELQKRENFGMLYYALVFFIVAIVAAFFGFGGIAAGAVGIAKILFVIFLVLTVVSLIAGYSRRV
jgi:uncharacterized membrane protein YtjA (UPF0391 family)